MSSLQPDRETRDMDAFMHEGAARAAALLRAVGNENRLLILCLLAAQGELCVSALQAQVGLSQSALSQHLARMRAMGLVTCRRESQNGYYSLANPDVIRLIDTLKEIFCP